MYVELDGDEVAVTYIKDIVFNANRAGVDTLRMTKVFAVQHAFGFLSFGSDCLAAHVFASQPPFVMDKWITGMHPNQRVDYTVNFEVRCAAHWVLLFGSEQVS